MFASTLNRTPAAFALAIVGPIAKVIDIRLRSAPPAAVPAPA